MSSPLKFTAADFAHDALGHGTHAIDPSGHVHGIHPSIRDALVERGLLVLDAAGVWRFTAEPPDFAEERFSYLAVCDFCSARPAPWTIPCRSFPVPAGGPGLPEAMSEGDWAACDPCGALVAQNDREGLLARCLSERADIMQPWDLRQAVRRVLPKLHKRFWKYYQGGAVRGAVRPFGH